MTASHGLFGNAEQRGADSSLTSCRRSGAMLVSPAGSAYQLIDVFPTIDAALSDYLLPMLSVFLTSEQASTIKP